MAIITPEQYIESLKDGRVVYCGGERVADVTQHPILRICRDWVAMDYVLQQDARYQDLVTEKNEEGEMECIALYKAPRTVEFVESLPKNPQGKILKKDIRSKYWKQQAPDAQGAEPEEVNAFPFTR